MESLSVYMFLHVHLNQVKSNEYNAIKKHPYQGAFFIFVASLIDLIACTLFFSRKIALPATNTSAPRSVQLLAVCVFTPPSISISKAYPFCVRKSRNVVIFDNTSDIKD